jgi:tRNA-5-methyluridine54 2-sulfurtransferase
VKCRVCRRPAVIDLRAHNANFCAEHFVRFCSDQVRKAVDAFQMLDPDERVLVAVSGGKDSLALWDILLELGYEADGLVIGLGIGEYSVSSTAHARAFAEARRAHLLEIDLRHQHGIDVPTAARATRRPPCSACGLSKRHLFDRAAVEGGYDALATGHNLDDEAAVLFGNTLRWNTDYLARQRPVLPARDGFPRKIKPLVRLGEREMAAYCVIKDIDYVVEECPMAVGNKHMAYKEALNSVESVSPGAKHAFYHEFLARAADRFVEPGEVTVEGGTSCARCGAPSTNEVCAFCTLVERTAGAEPVELRPRRRNGR